MVNFKLGKQMIKMKCRFVSSMGQRKKIRVPSSIEPMANQGLYWLGTLTTELQAELQETLGKLGHFTGFISDIIEGHPIPHLSQ